MPEKKRTKRPPRKVLAARLLSNDNLVKVCTTKCCDMLCCRTMMSVDSVRRAIQCTFELSQKTAGVNLFRHMFYCHCVNERGKLVFNFTFAVNETVINKDGKSEQRTVNRPVCQLAFLLGHGYGDRQFRRFRSAIRRGFYEYYASEVGLHKMSFDRRPLWRGIVAWIRNTADAVGDRMPDSEELRLPWPNGKEVYDNYLTELKDRGEQPASYWYFLTAWRSDLPHVRCTKPHTPFATCNKCTSFTMQLRQQNITAAQRNDIHAQRKAHLDQQRAERQEYYAIRDKSLSDTKFLPDGRRVVRCACFACSLLACSLARSSAMLGDCSITVCFACSIIVDGMDQAKNNMPHFHHKSKLASSANLLKQCVMGVIVHGWKRFLYLAHEYVDFDSNLTIECIHRTIQALRAHGPLPPVLCVQLDNCAGTNKNLFVFSYLGWLVQQGVFEEVHVSFLMVGHTHEDIDQMFSVISRYLKQHDAPTLSAYKDAIKNVRKVTVYHANAVICQTRSFVLSVLSMCLHHSHCCVLCR